MIKALDENSVVYLLVTYARKQGDLLDKELNARELIENIQPEHRSYKMAVEVQGHKDWEVFSLKQFNDGKVGVKRLIGEEWQPGTGKKVTYTYVPDTLQISTQV